LGRKIIPDVVASFLLEEEIENFFLTTRNAWKEYYIEKWLKSRKGSSSERQSLERILKDIAPLEPELVGMPKIPKLKYDEPFPKHLKQIWLGLHPEEEIPIGVDKLLEMLIPIIFLVMITSVITGLLKQFFNEKGGGKKQQLKPVISN